MADFIHQFFKFSGKCFADIENFTDFNPDHSVQYNELYSLNILVLK